MFKKKIGHSFIASYMLGIFAGKNEDVTVTSIIQNSETVVGLVSRPKSAVRFSTCSQAELNSTFRY